MPANHRAYERTCATLMQAHWRRPVHEGPVVLQLHIWIRRPKRLLRVADRGVTVPHTAKPDVDNAAGIPMDALVKAKVLHDDTQVVELHVRRQYVPLLADGRLGAAEGVELTLLLWRP